MKAFTVRDLPNFIKRLEDFEQQPCEDDDLHGLLIGRFLFWSVVWLTCEEARKLARAEAETQRIKAELRASFIVALLALRPILIRGAVVAVVIYTTLHGSIEVYRAYSQDGPQFAAIIPAIMVMLFTLAVGLGRWGALLLGGFIAYGIGYVVGHVDFVVRALIIMGALGFLIAENQTNREGNEMQTRRNSNAFMTLMKIGLVIYTMARSVDLVSNTLPDEQGIKLLGLFVVFGLDIALIVWDNYTADPYKARSDGQHKVGVLMIGLNMLGVGAALIADSARILDPVGSQELIYTVSIYGIPAVIICNLAGMIGVNQLDPDRVEAQRQAEHERELNRIEGDHRRAIEMANKQSELAVVQLHNDQRIKRIKDKYFEDANGNGQLDSGEVSAPSLDELVNLIAARLTAGNTGLQAMAAQGEPRDDRTPKA